MCGRYILTIPWSDLVALFRITETLAAPNLPPRYNIAPTQTVPAVRRTSDGDGRRMDLLRWGLVPAWAKDAAIGARMINARAETAAEKPAFRAAMRYRRCLIPSDGFYEWQKRPSGPKQPFRIARTDGRTFAFAGLWERWDRTPDGRPLETFTIITTAANAVVAPIHDRMPVILDAADHEAWLDVDGVGASDAARLLKPSPPEEMTAHAVSRHVNAVRNDDPRCITPVDDQ